MAWVTAYRAVLGVTADCLSFAGATLLARDAFLRLRELRRYRISQAFQRRFPELNLHDEEISKAISAARWTLTGFCLLMAGFVLQVIVRLFGG